MIKAFDTHLSDLYSGRKMHADAFRRAWVTMPGSFWLCSNQSWLLENSFSGSFHFSLMHLLWMFRAKNKFYTWQSFLSWFQLSYWHSSRPWQNTSWFSFFNACIQCSRSPSFQLQTELCGLGEELTPWPVPLSSKSSFSESYYLEGEKKMVK